MWTEKRKGWGSWLQERAARASAPRPQSLLARTDQTLGEPKSNEKYQKKVHKITKNLNLQHNELPQVGSRSNH